LCRAEAFASAAGTVTLRWSGSAKTSVLRILVVEDEVFIAVMLEDMTAAMSTAQSWLRTAKAAA
jgi:hypothetical protein